MKKVIIITLLVSTIETRCFESNETGPYIYLAGFLGYCTYHFFLKDPNIRLKEQYDNEQRSSELNISIGNAYAKERNNNLKKLEKFLSEQPNKSSEDIALQKYVSQQLVNE